MEYTVRLIPLGGVTDVTKNMYVYELYKDSSLEDILIVDCGIGFPKEQELGVDLVIPDISYLKDKVDKIRAVLLTHGHEDHISALPYHYKDLGSPPVYTSKLTSYFVKGKFEEAEIPCNVTEVEYKKIYTFGLFKVFFIHLTHSIPDPTHIVIQTPVGNFYHGADYKIDLTPPYEAPPDFYSIANSGREGILCLMTDCLGVEREGFALSESIVGSTFEELIRTTKGKFIMTTFSSNISRIRQCVEAAVKYNRKICFLGRSMKQNVELARAIQYLPIPNNFVIDEKEVVKTDQSRLCLIVAGSQGQYDSALSKLATNQNRFIKIGNKDRVLFSSDPIPGNEDSVNDVIEKLYIKGADVIYPSIQDQLHASGHGNQEDMKLMVRLTNPKYIVPIGGELRHQRQYQQLVESMGYANDKVFVLEDGQTLLFTTKGAILGDKVAVKNVYVDAYGVGDVGNVILRDRQTIGKEGIVFVSIPLAQNYHLIKPPEFLSRGFVYRDNETELFSQATRLIDKLIGNKKNTAYSKNSLEREIINNLEQYFQKSTGRTPLVCVSIIEL